MGVWQVPHTVGDVAPGYQDSIASSGAAYLFASTGYFH